jgi:hypothetical protein
MTKCFGISVCCILCLVTPYLPGSCHDKAKNGPGLFNILWLGMCSPHEGKGDAHETLSLVFQRDKVPPTMVTDDSKEQTKGEF